MLGCKEGIKLGLSDGKVMDTTLGDANRIQLGDDVKLELGVPYGSFYGSSDGNLDSSSLGDSL